MVSKTHFQRSWMAQEKYRKAAGVLPCSIQHSVETNSWVRSTRVTMQSTVHYHGSTYRRVAVQSSSDSTHERTVTVWGNFFVFFLPFLPLVTVITGKFTSTRSTAIAYWSHGETHCIALGRNTSCCSGAKRVGSICWRESPATIPQSARVCLTNVPYKFWYRQLRL